MNVRVQDAAGVQAGDGCTAQRPTVAVCPVRRTAFADQSELGDGSDTLTLAGNPRGPEGPAILDGSGSDVVRGSSAGDSFFDGPGRDRHSGRGGDDMLFSGSGADVLSGGPGSDAVSYDPPLGSPRRGGVRADLDRRADDGSAGERDRIRTDVENLAGMALLTCCGATDGPTRSTASAAPTGFSAWAATMSSPPRSPRS